MDAARSMCAVKGSLGHSSNRCIENRKARTRACGTSGHASGWVRMLHSWNEHRLLFLRRGVSSQILNKQGLDGRKGGNKGGVT